MENSSPAPQGAPPQSLQNHEPSLGSLPISHTHLCQNSSHSRRKNQNVVASPQGLTNTTASTREYTFSASPSLLQQAALAVLQQFDNEVAFAWLTGLRSFRPDGNHWFQPSSLSSEQFDAVSALKDCPDGLISEWLDFTRAGGAFAGPQCLSGCSHIGARSTSATLYHNSWQGSSNTSRSSAGSWSALPTFYDSNTLPTTPTSSRSRETFLDLSSEAPIDEATQSFPTSHRHWCFICPNPREITTCDGWKRHVKEHETRFHCMPGGPIEQTADGTKCAFCGLQNPNESHCDIHKAFPCGNKSLDGRSYTRKTHFTQHLKTHGVLDGTEFAERWKLTVDKKHFSCGFCVALFHSLIEQLSHIDTVHYRSFQHIRDWDSNKVIWGLLLQPSVLGSWRRILASHPGLIESSLRWDSSVIKRLQLRLEMGNDSPDALAEMAFNESTYGSSHHGEAEMIDAARVSHNGGVAARQRPLANQATSLIDFGLHKTPVAEGDTMTYSNSHMDHAGPWASHCSPPHNYFMPQYHPNVSEGNTAMGFQQVDLDNSLRPMTSSNNYRTEPELSSSTPWTSNRPFDSNLTISNNSMTGNFWHPSPILSPTNSSSIISSQPRYHGQARVGETHARLANQRAPSTSSRKGPRLTQSAAAFAKRSYVGQPRREPSRSKLKDHYDISTEADIDIDFDFVQRSMVDDDSTRSERRSR